MTDEDLSNLFTQYGSVTSAKILKDKMNGRSKGFGFVEMEDDEAAKTAIANLNESEVMGRKLIVNESQPREGGASGGGGFKKRKFRFRRRWRLQEKRRRLWWWRWKKRRVAVAMAAEEAAGGGYNRDY
ncbi:MAG: RNA-binding protein [Ferruginibacter sp.]